jgi:hypothetical protein
MKTSVIEVRGMLSALSAHGVEKRIGEVLSVKCVTVNYAAGSATVRYDETRQVTAPLMDPTILGRRVMTDVWKIKVHAFSLATTLGVAYILCAIFDVLFPPFGLLAALAPASPWPIFGSPLAFLTGFASFTVVGFVLGALYGIVWEFWSKRLR